MKKKERFTGRKEKWGEDERSKTTEERTRERGNPPLDGL